MAQHGRLYKGYSSFEFQKNKNLRLTDVEVVKMDLLSHIFTFRGTRVMMPNFGSLIPELAFEQLDDTLIDDVYEELTNVFNYDPRVEIVSLQIIPDFDNNAVYAKTTLNFIELNTVDDFSINIQFEG